MRVNNVVSYHYVSVSQKENPASPVQYQLIERDREREVKLKLVFV